MSKKMDRIGDVMHDLSITYHCTIEQVNDAVGVYVEKIDTILENSRGVQLCKNRK